MTEIIEAYCDGGCITRNPSPDGGTWAWVHVGTDGEIVASGAGVIRASARYPSITNNYAEYVAAVRCLSALPKGWSGRFYCDSQITIGRLFWGWAMSGIPIALLRRADSALHNLGTVSAIHLDGHPTRAELAAGYSAKGRPVSPWNVMCDNMCQEAATTYRQQVTGATRTAQEAR